MDGWLFAGHAHKHHTYTLGERLRTTVLSKFVRGESRKHTSNSYESVCVYAYQSADKTSVHAVYLFHLSTLLLRK